MGRIVILEGPDGSGKTTLAKQFVDRGWNYVHLGVPEPYEDLLTTYATKLYQANLDPKNTVFDRLHLGERVYGSVVRNNDKLGEEGTVLLQRMINGLGAVVVLCLPPYPTAYANWKFRNELKTEFISEPTVYEKIYNRYLQFTNGDFIDLYYDYTTCSLEMAETLIDKLGEGFPPLPNGMIGATEAKFLIIGERANSKYLDVPFMALDNSSHFLYETMKEAGFEEGETAFMNAVNINGNANNLAYAWNQIGALHRIFLGNIARELFTKQTGLGGISIPHPAFWKRFHSSDREGYVKQLREARGVLHSS